MISSDMSENVTYIPPDMGHFGPYVSHAKMMVSSHSKNHRNLGVPFIIEIWGKFSPEFPPVSAPVAQWPGLGPASEADSNCLASSEYFSVCCADPCEDAGHPGIRLECVKNAVWPWI